LSHGVKVRFASVCQLPDGCAFRRATSSRENLSDRTAAAVVYYHVLHLLRPFAVFAFESTGFVSTRGSVAAFVLAVVAFDLSSAIGLSVIESLQGRNKNVVDGLVEGIEF